MEFISSLSILISAGGLFFSACGCAAARRFFRRSSGPDTAGIVPTVEGISVLKPLKGIDRETRRNLESFFWLSYPRFELLFCVAEHDDPAVVVVQELLRQYPDVSARLFVGETVVGPNPKVNNLMRGYSAAQYETLLISDSNIRVEVSYLQEMASQLRGNDMISSVVIGHEARNFAGFIEEIFLGAFYARPMILSLEIGRPAMMGKSMMFRRSAMEKVGGLVSLAPYLAEDFVAGEKFRRAGFAVSLSQYPVNQVVGQPTIRAFWSRHLRWGRIRKTHAPLAFLFEPFFTNALLSGALGAWALAKLTALPFLPLYGTDLALWFALDCLTIRSGGGRLRWLTPLYWLAREAIHLPLWIHIASGNRIQWKGGGWRLGGDGRLTAVDTEPQTVGEREDEGVAARPIRRRPPEVRP